MSKVAIFVACALAIALLSTVALGQEGTSSQSTVDPFASIHEALSSAADRSLAATLLQRPWMKTSEGMPENPTNPGITALGGLEAAVARVNRLRPTIEPILRQEGVPVELSAVVLVESGGLAAALSPKGARGVWQFMPDTARRYGLVVQGPRDERLDVEKSTRAAARYLSDLYGEFGDWSLALAAYNAGEQSLQGALDRSGTRSFAVISGKGLVPAETRSYVPAVLAAMNRLYEGNTLASDHNEPTKRAIYASSGAE